MKVGHSNRNRDVLQQVLVELEKKEIAKHVRPKQSIDDQVQYDRQYRQLSKYSSMSVESKCYECSIKKFCSACSPVNFVFTPASCSNMKKVIAKYLLKRELHKIKLEVVK